MKVEGGCHCGAIAYEAEVDPRVVGICHCTDCQTLSGSPYRVVVPIATSSFVLHRGQPKVYVKTAESGTKRAQAFCSDCGSPIYAAAPVDPPTMSLRWGSIKERAGLKPVRQIWCRSSMPWAMDLGDLPRTGGQT